MQDKVRTHFESLFQLLYENNKIIIPPKSVINEWEKVLSEWIEDDIMTLFARKGGEIRGKEIENAYNRRIITTDNTPAHWVFKRVVMDKIRITKGSIHDLLVKNEFPIAFIRKKNEYITLPGKMVADKEIRLNEQGWKLAHINGIALKRGKNIPMEEYKKHHNSFLSLDNMYLIDKSFSGLAEVELFNEIIRKAK